MQRCGGTLFIAIFIVLVMTVTSCGAVVMIQVVEKGEFVAPVQGALVYSNGTPIGKTDEEGLIEALSPTGDSVPLRVEKYGYDPWEGTIGPKTDEVFVELQRAELSLSVHLYDADTMDPLAGVNVTLEGEEATTSALSDQNGTAVFPVQARGSYRIKAGAEQYQPVSMEVEAGIADKEVQVVLLRGDRFSIVVKDGESGETLQGARVSVEGIEKGISDARGILNLPLPRDKVYLIRVVMDGYQEYYGHQIVESDTAFLTIPLIKAPFTVFISVSNEDADPVDGALVLVNGTPVGSTGSNGRLVLTNLTAGLYQVEIQHPSYVPAQHAVIVATQGEDIATELKYQQENRTIKAVEGTGNAVTGVRISLNGKEAGITGDTGTIAVLLRMNQNYTITAEKDGYHAVAIERMISAKDGTSLISIPMEQDFNWLFLAVAGIGMIIIVVGILVFRRRMHPRSHGKGGGL
ncbi:MAG: carboxypeptidase regulatory-like domain-containing protein [Methanolinea sp.]|nr:carboxypeptidase regulatory-like domain-containing protein [Methanolinea sp.]